MLEITSGWKMAFSCCETPEFLNLRVFPPKKRRQRGAYRKYQRTRQRSRKPSNFQNLLFILNRASSRDAINLYFIGGTGV